MKSEKLIEVVEGTLWRGDSLDIRVSKLGSQWYLTLGQTIGGDVREVFSSKKQVSDFLKSHNWSVKF